MTKYSGDNDFISLKKYVDGLSMESFADLPDVPPLDIGEYHYAEKDIHHLDTSCIEIYRNRPLRVEVEWNFCKQCKKLSNHKVVLYNNARSFCYVRYLVKHGVEQ